MLKSAQNTAWKAAVIIEQTKKHRTLSASWYRLWVGHTRKNLQRPNPFSTALAAPRLSTHPSTTDAKPVQWSNARGGI